MELTLDIFIDAAPEAVFTHIIDIPGWSRGNPAILRIEMLTDGGVALGTRFRETRLMFGREATEEMTVAGMEPPSRLMFTADSHGTRYRSEFRIRPEGQGSRLAFAFEGRPYTLPARLLSPLGYLMAGTVRRMIAADLEHLKRAVEGTAHNA